MSVWRARPDWLRAAVQSVLGQSLRDLELIVLEDPPHGPLDLAGEFGDGRLRHVRAETGSDLPTSRARTLELARSDLVAILDADDLCHPDRLRRQVAFLDAHPEVAVVGTAIEVIDEHDRRLGYRVHPAGHDSIARAMRRHNPLAHPSVLFRKAAVLAAGGYRTRPGAACDDYELWARLAAHGARFANLQEPLLRYRLHGGAMKARLLRATLRDTLWIKRHYFAGRLDLGDRLRILGERALLALPAPLVASLFRHTQLRATAPGAEDW